MTIDSKLKVLITGITGFLGGGLATRLSQETHLSLRGAVRKLSLTLSSNVEQVMVPNLDGQTDWEEALREMNIILHVAARVHIMDEKALDPLSEFRRVNVEGTLNLARQGAAVGVKRFIFISSIKVNGEATIPGHAFKADDIVIPEDPYAISKYEAETGLRQIAMRTGMEVVIVRPPLVYGPGVKANFNAMMRWLARGMPLPLGAVTENRRSLVALDNLVDLLVTCIDHPAAANQIFLASDGDDLSTTDLLRRMSQTMGKPARLLPVPPVLLKMGARLLGKSNFAERLLGSLQVEITKTRELLDWAPPISVEEGLRRAAADFVN